jgi:hypothetical protein
MIGKFFGEDYKPESVKAVQNVMMLEPVGAMVAAYSRAISEFPQRYLPPISKIRDIVLQEGKKIRELETQQREREAAEMKKEEAQPIKEPSTPYGRACATFLAAAYSGEYGREQLWAMAEKQEARFHKMGFEQWLNGVLAEEGWAKRHERSGAVKDLAA